MYSNEKEEFYKSKLRWKLQRSGLSFYESLLFDNFDDLIRSYLLEYTTFNASPVITFWSSKELWTFISGLEVVSMHHGEVHRIFLDDIKKKIKVPPLVKQGQESKMDFNCVALGDVGVKIWAPEGKEIFTLMNILQMFPLCNGKD
ncbi:hypothetical protein [Leminorella grimontii]|uniref:hypothetical protein n=1 Tax=Leminorella grimontii TaxID=82981 RepID=UPI002089BC95|nr:hypothetical protein [Leminorella grimontii]GKX59195.1 hypothetical protein SOASR031_15100 [Leminorella grimontii]